MAAANYINPTAVSAPSPGFKDSPFNIPSYIKPFPFGQQRERGEEFLTGVGEHIAGLETPQNIMDRVAGQLNLPSMREQYLRMGEAGEDITSQLFAMPETVRGLTGQSMATEAQRAGLVSKMAEQPLQQLGELGRQAMKLGERIGMSEQQLTERMGAELYRQEQTLLPFEMGFDLLKINQAREFSGYTFSNQLELDRLIGNQQTGYGWSTDEAERANKLAIAEGQYRNNLDQIRLQSELGHTSYSGASGDYGSLWNMWG